MLPSSRSAGYMTEYARFSWTVLLPVKVLARAKSRLAVLAGDRRRELALALAADTLAAAAGWPAGARGGAAPSAPVAAELLASLGGVVVPDDPPGLTGGRPAVLDAPAGTGVQEG